MLFCWQDGIDNISCHDHHLELVWLCSPLTMTYTADGFCSEWSHLLIGQPRKEESQSDCATSSACGHNFMLMCLFIQSRNCFLLMLSVESGANFPKSSWKHLYSRCSLHGDTWICSHWPTLAEQTWASHVVTATAHFPVGPSLVSPSSSRPLSCTELSDQRSRRPQGHVQTGDFQLL